jgi:hypothetical protein
MITKYTNSTLFLLPGLGLHRTEIEDRYYFLNAYVADQNRVFRIKHPIVLVFDNGSIGTDFLTDHPDLVLYFEDTYVYDDKFTVIIFSFPERYSKDYNLVLKGKYSKLSKAYMELFPELGMSGKPSLYHHIFNKTEGLRNYWQKNLDSEIDTSKDYWQTFDLERETFDYKNIKQ